MLRFGLYHFPCNPVNHRVDGVFVYCAKTLSECVGSPVIRSGLGPEARRFESCHSDQKTEGEIRMCLFRKEKGGGKEKEYARPTQQIVSV